ncbi:MAG: hypothetical protein R2711_11570 [Acidimicrobiales bacterium]
MYEAELARLQRELVKLQEWVRQEGLRLCVLFEGRDAAGKGGTIKRIVERTNPAWCGSWPSTSPPSASGPSGTSSATWPSCPPAARSCCSTGPGTTAPASSGSWASAPTRSTTTSSAPARRSRSCSSARGSCSSSTGSR